jgi:hypothetical protein
MLPDAPNEACPFPPVNFFFKSFSTISQSDEAQRLNVRLFLRHYRQTPPLNEGEQGSM